MDSEKQISVETWWRLLECSRILERQMKKQLEPEFGHGLSRFEVLAQLSKAADQSLSTGQLAQMLVSSDGNITRLLDRMEQQQLLLRQPSPQDRRRQIVVISKKGKKLYKLMAKQHARIIQSSIGQLGGDVNQMILRNLTKLTQLLESN